MLDCFESARVGVRRVAVVGLCLAAMVPDGRAILFEGSGDPLFNTAAPTLVTLNGPRLRGNIH